MHLTNVSVQKTAPDYDPEKVCKSKYVQDYGPGLTSCLLFPKSFIVPSISIQGCKWQMQQLRRYLTAKHGREMVETLFEEMDNIFVRSLLSVQKSIINDKHCFELYGYDILLDQNLKP